MTKIIHGDLILKKDTAFEEDLIVKGSIMGKDGLKYNLTVHGDISAHDIRVGNDIEAHYIDAFSISYYTITPGTELAANIALTDNRPKEFRKPEHPEICAACIKSSARKKATPQNARHQNKK